MEQANVRMDARAKEHWQRRHEEGATPEVDMAPWSVWIDNKMVIKDLKDDSLNDHCAGKFASVLVLVKNRRKDLANGTCQK